jgi:hypothetical protein
MKKGGLSALPGIFRSGILRAELKTLIDVKLRGPPLVNEVILEGLIGSSDFSLYLMAKESGAFADRFEEILDQRLQKVEELTKKWWAMDPDNFVFPLSDWLWLLHEGRVKDLERCLAWMRKIDPERGGFFSRSGADQFRRVLFNEIRCAELARANLLKTENFQWDPVLRRWNFNKKGSVK